MKFKNSLEYKMIIFIMLIAIILNVVLPSFSNLTFATETSESGIDWNDVFMTALIDQISLADDDNSLYFVNNAGTLKIEIHRRTF